MLALSRQWKEHQEQITSGKWKRTKYANEEIANKRLGIVGLGYCGSALASRALNLDMHVTYYDIRKRHTEYPDFQGVQYLTFEQLLKNSDIVSLHVPLTKATHFMMDSESLRLMKPEALLINTSRGEVVDEEALIQALRRGGLKGAGLDVFQKEPLGCASDLLKLHNVILTPHVGPSRLSQDRLVRNMLQNMLAVRAGRPLVFPAIQFETSSNFSIVSL